MGRTAVVFRSLIVAFGLLALGLAPAADNLRDTGRFGLPAGVSQGDLHFNGLPSGADPAALLTTEKRPRPPSVECLLAVIRHQSVVAGGRNAQSCPSDPGFDVPPSADRPALPIRSPPPGLS